MEQEREHDYIAPDVWLSWAELDRLKLSAVCQIYRTHDPALAIDSDDGPERVALMREFAEGARAYFTGMNVPDYEEIKLVGWIKAEFKELLPPMLVEAWEMAAPMRRALVMMEFRNVIHERFPEAKGVLQEGFVRAGGVL
jgi:hypothetical protein